MGYDTDLGPIAHPVANFIDFLHAKDPKGFLKSNHELRFTNEEDKVFLKSKSSKKELVYLCGDLQQVSDADMKRLLRWREQLLREQSRFLKEDDEAPVFAGSDDDSTRAGLRGSDDDDDDDDDAREPQFDWDSKEGITAIARELLEVRKRKEKELKKKQKKVVDRKLKQIKGLINYDPNSSAEHMTETDGFEHMGDDDENGDADSNQDEGDGDSFLDAFTVEKLAHVDEKDVAAMLDRHWEDPEDKGNVPLNPIVSVDLAAEDDWDLGDGEGDDNDETGDAAPAARDRKSLQELLPQSEQLVEGEEYFMDVDNYGNYVKGERSARVKLYEEGLEGDEEPEEEEEEAEDAARGAEKPQKDKTPKWESHHKNIDKILRDTFPTPKEDNKRTKREAQKRKRALEEERVVMHAEAPLRQIPGEASLKRSRTKFEDRADDENDDDDDDDEDAMQFSDDDACERPDLDVRKGRVDSRRKRRIVEDLSQLTTQELVRSQRKQTTKDNREVRKQNRRNKNDTNAGKDGKSGKEDTQFEEVPLAMTDPEVRARTLAIAQSMLDPRSAARSSRPPSTSSCTTTTRTCPTGSSRTSSATAR
ncbi:AdoMet-dependent rRNA methyltransferase SPB1 [Strigomonas culicis]|uniref:AdoMet-dependent rRNA methyltransferase SPB1 n=1 Tax=Strigomonas culicis TaxID=28005 RepID=S9TSC4_9TRYP|nr:AdoMet-dependent rRNA methyltransferase SPB1 [Strigomonas culicis]|eukprot:EPY19469.1 AdoMet-dependent rRNA methyltransferase SPB1 [Strigomonas culicis]